MSNFKLIARNVAGYFCHVRAHHSHEVSSDHELLASVGVVTVLPYIARGRIDLGDIVRAAFRSQYNTITLLPDRIDLYEGLARLDARTDRLRNFTLTLEALIFAADMPRMDSSAILAALRAKLGTVERALEKALQRPVPAIISATREARWPQVDLNRIRALLSAQQPQ